ncbi:hypothetical protein Pint_09684 [Pistacia integerrima]|uniref:Uncharacterized protein n=1 Tax=Pistacia integerrima TaxID=434235 RepID=A0ACC0XER5_9ROSI|nr:hypothetical protein Pint_09684 [Pistacia integerrima]
MHVTKEDVDLLDVLQILAVIKSNKDTRYGLDSIVTYDGVKLSCCALANLSSFRQKFGSDAYDKFCREAANHDGKTVIVAGLNSDYLRGDNVLYSFLGPRSRSFGSVLDIIPHLADFVTVANSAGSVLLHLKEDGKDTDPELHVSIQIELAKKGIFRFFFDKLGGVQEFKVIDNFLLQMKEGEDALLMKSLTMASIKALCKAVIDKGTEKVNTALEFLRDMIHRGLTPDIVTYDNLINVGTARGACLMMFVSFCIKELRTAFYLMMLLGISWSQIPFKGMDRESQNFTYMQSIGDSNGTFRKWHLFFTLLLSLLSFGRVLGHWEHLLEWTSATWNSLDENASLLNLDRLILCSGRIWPGSQLSSFCDTSCLQVKFYEHGRHFSVKSHVLVMVAVYPICKVKISKGDVHIICKCIVAASARMRCRSLLISKGDVSIISECSVAASTRTS